MGFGRRIGDTFRVPGRGLRRGVAVLTVLVTAAAIGSAVALSAPQLLGSSAADAPAIPVPVPALGPLPADAPLPTAAGLTAALQPVTGTSALGTFGGAVLDPSTGSQLWQRAVDQPLAPGSTAKLLTSAAALLTLAGTDHLYTKVVQGPTPGSVVIVGGGDPSLTDLPPARTPSTPTPRGWPISPPRSRSRWGTRRSPP
ncbi:D-alanyl-D-alanine carboxypeptidase [Pseudonocardia benzenivorans]